MLRACLLLWLAGCDWALGLERPGHDEDSDGTPDDFDGCPHLAGESPTDVDGDDIPAACDADDSVATTNRLFWTFLDGQRPAELLLDQGSATPDPDAQALVLGHPLDGFHALVLDVTTDTALIDIGFEVLDNAIEDGGSDTAYTEFGLFAAHRSFGDPADRGDNCFVGRNRPPGTGFLELNEDDESRGGGKSFDPPLTGTAGRMRMVRSARRFDCAMVRASGSELGDGFAIQDTGRTGKLAITAERLRVRLTYVWITYQ